MSIFWRTVSGIAGSIGHGSIGSWAGNFADLFSELTGIEGKTGVGDVSFITNRIATGAALSDATDIDQIIAAGIDVVVDARNDFDDGQLFIARPEIHYLWNPTADDGTPKPPAYWQRTLEFALPFLAWPGHKVYLHCKNGCNRGPSSAFAVMVALSFDPKLAEQLIRNARPVVGLAYKADALAACKSLGYIT